MNILEDFCGVNKHLFRKIAFMIKAHFFYKWHNSDSLKLYESVRIPTLLYYYFFLFLERINPADVSFLVVK